MDKSPGYTITSENQDFLTKLQDVFSGIDTSTSNMLSSDSAIESDEERSESGCVTKNKSRKSEKLKGRKQPPKPDYIVNPSRYTKYSLEDTELADNRSNAQIAFQFLQELEDRKIPSALDKNPAEAVAKHPTFRMPEHAVGLRKAVKDKSLPDAKKSAGEASSCDKVELEHLEENISAKEFASEIAAKLDESMSNLSSEVLDSSTTDSNKRPFKSVLKKDRRHLRSKVQEDE